jgi:acid phosphatase type 7
MKNQNAALRATLLSIALASAFSATAQTVSRGPYLQASTENSVVVKWRTSTATESVVRFGTVQGTLDRQQVLAGTRTDHEVVVTGLAADTKYFYAVGTPTATLAGNDPTFFFRANPVQGTPKPMRVWVLGDAGRGSSQQIQVRDAYLNFTGARGTDHTLLLGDNAYEDGTDAEYQSKHFAIYPMVTRNTVMWSTRGNHERDANAYYSIFAMPRNGEAGGVASGTEAYHAFNIGNVHFINLDSYGSSRSATGPMATWLKNDLAANTLPWVVAYWHHPPYTKGSHDSDSETELIDMRQNIVPILEQYGVDLVLGGHSHSYERSFLLDGHYGSSSTLTAAMKKDGGSGRTDGSGAYTKPAGMTARQGAVYAVPGSSGTISGGSLNHPAMFISLNNLGSMVLDFDGPRLEAKFVRENGTVADHFTIVKDGSVNTPPTVAVSSPASGATFVAPASITVGANASDSDGTVAKVEFFAGSTLIGTSMSAPYSAAWTNVAAGSYSLTAKATDDKGASKTSAAVGVTVNAAANVSPTVSLTSPANGASYTAPASITLAANAADSDGTIAKVEFFNGGTLIGSDTSAPYSFAWSNVAVGNYSLTARATDNRGGVTTSGAVSVSVNAAANVAPTVSLTAPANGASFTAPASIVLAASAADSDGTIARVEFFNGGTLIGTDTSAPYSINWSNVGAGSYSLTARATDDKGSATTSAAATVTVSGAPVPNAPPTVSVVSPINGSSFIAPANVTINANAADSDGNVAKVELLQGGTLLATDTAAPYSFALSNLAAGSYGYTVRATDDKGASASAALNFTATAPTGGGGTAASYKVNSAYDKKNNKTYRAGGPDGDDPVRDLNSTSDAIYKVEVEQGSGYWWEIHYADPASTAGAPSSTVVTLHVVPEESWTGSFTLQYLEGSTVLAQVNLPLDSRKDEATGKGKKLVYSWDLSAQVPGLATLAAGKVRAINAGSGNGKKVFITYSLQNAQH